MNVEDFLNSTIYQILLKYEGFIEQRKEDIEMSKVAVMLGYASAKKGKEIKIFKEEEKQKVGRITTEEKEKQMKKLLKKFDN